MNIDPIGCAHGYPGTGNDSHLAEGGFGGMTLFYSPADSLRIMHNMNMAPFLSPSLAPFFWQ